MSAPVDTLPIPPVKSSDPAEPSFLAPTHPAQGSWTRFVGPAEWMIGGLILAASLALHGLQNAAAGGLWRDEVTSVQVASLPTLGLTWRYLEFDSYPILYHLVLRTWNGVFGSDDFSLRLLGLLIGVALLAVCWVAARVMNVRVPLLAWALLGLNPLVIRYGDSIRAYGLGCSLAVLAAAAVWRVAQLERPDWRRAALAALAGIVSVQCLYHNAALLLASCLGGASVALWRRQPKIAVLVLATGLPAALSLLPYLPTIHRTGQWSILFRFPVTLAWLWERVSEVTGSPRPAGVWLWTGLALTASILAGWRLGFSRRSPASDPSGTAQGTAAVTLATGTAIYTAFLFLVSYVTQPWYYLAFLALTAVCLDAVFGQTRETVVRIARLALVVTFALLAFPAAQGMLNERNTNADLVALQLNKRVQPGDLVVVVQWEFAISLNRYYHGPAPLITMPLLDDHNVHRYDLIKQAIETPDPLRPAFARMEQTLRAGSNIWVVGEADLPEGDRRVPVPAPVPPGFQGDWHAGDRYANWYAQTGQFLIDHCDRVGTVLVFPEQAVNKNEIHPLIRVSGWK